MLKSEMSSDWLKEPGLASNRAAKVQGVPAHLFIKGPLPLWWILTALRECGKSSAVVGMILFHRYGLKRKPAPISKREAEKWGITRNTKDTALRKLHQSNLIKMEDLGRRRCPALDLSTREPAQ
jgi:hypothetical protein